MTERNDKRRRLLKSIAAGSGAVVVGKSLPESWSKPVIDTVVLPAHATTTDDSGSASGSLTTQPPCCLTAGSYCGPATNQELNGKSIISVMITVAANGGIEVAVYDGCSRWVVSSTIACTGGAFDVTAIRDDSYVNGCAPSEGGSGDFANAPTTFAVTGTIPCSAASISGTVSYSDTVLNYQALLGECDA